MCFFHTGRGLPFVYFDLIECDCNGRKCVIDGYDIILDVPPGIIPKGKVMKFEVGVIISGPFSFKESTQPISPVLWFHFPNETAESEQRKLFRIILPHCLVGLTMEKILFHQICFVKANLSVEGEKQQYIFTQYDTAIANFLKVDRCGVLQTECGGLFCITMLKNSECDNTDVISYCLAQVDLPSSPPIYEFDFYALLDLASHKRVR